MNPVFSSSSYSTMTPTTSSQVVRKVTFSNTTHFIEPEPKPENDIILIDLLWTHLNLIKQLLAIFNRPTDNKEGTDDSPKINSLTIGSSLAFDKLMETRCFDQKFTRTNSSKKKTVRFKNILTNSVQILEEKLKKETYPEKKHGFELTLFRLKEESLPLTNRTIAEKNKILNLRILNVLQRKYQSKLLAIVHGKESRISFNNIKVRLEKILGIYKKKQPKTRQQTQSSSSSTTIETTASTTTTSIFSKEEKEAALSLLALAGSTQSEETIASQKTRGDKGDRGKRPARKPKYTSTQKKARTNPTGPSNQTERVFTESSDSD